MDREKVIKALEDFCKNRICLPHLIPWNEIADAISMLKEQEPKTVTDIQLSRDGFIFGGCPKCKALITHADHKKYCGYCGQAVKWNE